MYSTQERKQVSTQRTWAHKYTKHGVQQISVTAMTDVASAHKTNDYNHENIVTSHFVITVCHIL